MDQQQVMRITKALADPTRFRILQTIAAAGESCCSELATRFPVTQATCSQHAAGGAVQPLPLRARHPGSLSQHSRDLFRGCNVPFLNR